MSRTVLLAIVGTSPAVLTETVWALANQTPSVVPDVVCVLTTKTGKNRLNETLRSGSPTVWEEMRAALSAKGVDVEGKLAFGDAAIRCFPDADGNEADDLRDSADSLRAADTMLAEIRRYCDDPSWTILASIAGGRKTMSALLMNCMSLLGREQDKVYHVLVPPQFEYGMSPPFYFPQRGLRHRIAATGKTVPSRQVAIELFEVPFVRMRGWYQEKFKSLPPTYAELVRRVSGSGRPAQVMPPLLVLDLRKGQLSIDGRVCSMSAMSFALLLVVMKGVFNQDDQFELLMKMHGLKGGARLRWFAEFQDAERMQVKADGRRPEIDVVRHTANELRCALGRGGLCGEEILRLMPKRGKMGDYPRNRLRILHWCDVAELCGHLFSTDLEGGME